MVTFFEWLELTENTKSTRGKAGLYPSLYTQYWNYPCQSVINWNADSITYMDPEHLKFKFLYKPWFTPQVVPKNADDYGNSGPD